MRREYEDAVAGMIFAIVSLVAIAVITMLVVKFGVWLFQ